MGVRVEALGSQGWQERAYRRGRKSGRAQMLLAAKSGKESQITRRKALPQRSLTFFSELLECNNKDQKLTTKGTKGARRAQRWKRGSVSDLAEGTCRGWSPAILDHYLRA